MQLIMEKAPGSCRKLMLEFYSGRYLYYKYITNYIVEI
jgi:hypothetical protein